jgi:hypothetical protein
MFSTGGGMSGMRILLEATVRPQDRKQLTHHHL